MSLRAGGINCIEMTCSKNYISKDGKHPEIGIAMYGHDVVFSKEELTDNNWFFCNENPAAIDDAKIQVDTLVFFEKCIAIVN